MYDDFYWMNHFGDPGYRYHALMAQLWGVLALRLGNAEILPFDFESYGASIRQFVADLDDSTNLSRHIDLDSLLHEVAEFQQAAHELNSSIGAAIAEGRLDPAAASRVNRALMQVERNWCIPQGIPGRPWFKHLIYAARYTYAHLELPGLTEAAEAGDWKRAAEQARILGDELVKNIALLRQTKQEVDSMSEVVRP
jgi:N-acetylated-alpha-linked acidic dipeptidase